MVKIYSGSCKCLLFFTLTISIVCSSFIFAEDLQDNPQANGSSSVTEVTQLDLQKKVFDFSNGSEGFMGRDFWKTVDGEMQFIPTKKTQQLFCTNLYMEYFPPQYIISVNTRWIDGSRNHGYGLIFNYHNKSGFYCFLLTQSGYISIFSNRDQKWKTIKRWKNSIITKNINNSLKVIREDTSIKCFINDSLAFEFKDEFPTNEICVGICTDGRVHCGFKNLTIERLSGN